MAPSEHRNELADPRTSEFIQGELGGIVDPLLREDAAELAFELLAQPGKRVTCRIGHQGVVRAHHYLRLGVAWMLVDPRRLR
jgi:hypothetical protein